MTIGDVLAAITLAVVLFGSWLAMLLLAAGLCPGRVAAAEARIQRSPLRCAMRGLLVVAVAAIVVVGLLARLVGPERIAALLVAGCLLAASAVGSAAIARRIARRFCGGEPAMGDVARGGVVLILACLCPLCGWLVVLPAGLLAAVGAAVSFPLLSRPAVAVVMEEAR